MGFRLEVFREGMRREGGKRESERLTLTRKQLRVLEMRVEKNSMLELHDFDMSALRKKARKRANT